MPLCLLLTALLFAWTTLSMAQDAIHDPSTIVKGDNNRYYVFATGDGVYCMSSTNANFTDRKVEPTPIDPVNYPAWINSYVTGFGGNFWAPDIIFMNGYYYLYYSASSFGSSRSAIGVTRTASLATPTWEDQGMVVYSDGSSTSYNAIDPALFTDTDGKVWMSYGSFFGGIAVIEINPATGKTIGSATKLIGGNHQSYEAPFIMKNDGYYYLFINRGACCKLLESTYYVEVLRATNVKGPYSGTRTFIPNQLGNIVGPGHIGYGEGVMSYHYYDGFSNGFPRLLTTSLTFENGWPVAGPNGVTLASINGTYALVAMHSNKAIGMPSAVADNGTNIAQYTYTGGDSQKFLISSTDGQWHAIKPAINSAKSFDVYEVSTANGANINLWDYWGGAGQQFSFMETAPGEYRLINRNSNRCVDIANASTADGANVLQWGCFAVAPQQTFKLVDLAATAVVEAGQMNRLEVYPNPSNGRFTVNVAQGNGSLAIVNLQGKQVFEMMVSEGANTIDAKLAPGLYIINVNTEQHSYQSKIRIR